MTAARWSQPCRRAGVVLAGFLGVAVVGAQPVDPAPAPAPRSFGASWGLSLEATGLETRGRAGGSGTEVLTSVSPSLTVAHTGGRLRGSLVYSGSLSSRRGIDDREETDFLSSLSAAYTAEVIDRIGFVDAGASVRQESVSAVGAPAGSFGLSGNRNEVYTATLSPSLRGPIAGLAEYELRATGSATRGRQDSTGNTDATQGLFALRSPRGGGILGWGLSGSRSRVKFLGSAATVTDRAAAELILQPDVEWRLAATGGKERTDVVGAVRRVTDNYGASIQWTPSPRTTVRLQGEERYFGRGHRGLVEHRLARSVLRLSSSRDVVGADPLAAGQAVTLYELLYAELAAALPDPVQRDQFVLALIAATGRSRDELVNGGAFGLGGATVQRREDLFWTWAGRRLTLSLSGFVLDSERLDNGGTGRAARNDDVTQSGYAASAGWRLTPLTTTTVTGSRTLTRDNFTGLRSDLKSLSVGFSSRLGLRTTGGLSARYTVLNGAAESYRETALTGSLSLRF